MKVIPWSWTLYETYQICPRLCYETRIAKNFRDDPNNETLLWANAVHSELEHRIAYERPLPENMQTFEPYAARLVAAPGIKYVEQQVGITNPFADGGPQLTGYWDANCWHRGKDDYIAVNGHRALVMDHKTGKAKPGSLQLALSAIRVFVQFPDVTHIKTGFAWLASKTYTVSDYTRDQLPNLSALFTATVADMEWSESKNAWPAKPGFLCKKSRKPGSTYAGCIVASCPHSEFYKP